MKDKKLIRVLTKGKNLKSGTSYFTSLQTLYEVNKALLMTTERRQQWGRAKDLKVFLQFRPDEEEIERHYAVLARHWDALLTALPALRADPERMRAHELSDSDSGYMDHLLFWPVGQELVAEVARSLLDRSGLGDGAGRAEMESALSVLSEVPWDLHGAPWRYLLLVPGKSPQEGPWRMRSEDRRTAVHVAGGVVRWVVGLDPLNAEEVVALREDWRGLLYPEPPEERETNEMWQSVVDARERIVSGD